MAESEADTWGTLWLEGVELERIKWPQQSGMIPMLMAVNAILMVVGSFPDEMGLGWGAWHPNALLRLPRELVARLAMLLMVA